MRIALFSSVYGLGWGVGLIVRKHIGGLIENRNDVCLATPGVHHFEFPPNMQGKFTMVKANDDIDASRGIINEYKPDVIIAYSPPYYQHIANINDCTVIKVAYDAGEPFPFFWRGAEREMREAIDIQKYRDCMPLFHAHISISEFIKRTSGLKSSRVHYLGADHMEGAMIGENIPDSALKKEKKFTITSLSRLGTGEASYKGFSELLALKKRLESDAGEGHYRFIVIGRVARDGELVKMQLEDNGVDVLTDVSEEDKINILANSDVFFSPSLWEGFNLPLVEAQYIGVSAVAFSVGAHPEVCPFHFDKLDEIKDHIIKLDNDPYYKYWCAQICQEYVRRKFKWSDNVNQLVSLLDELQEKREEGKLLTLLHQNDGEWTLKTKCKKAVEQHLLRMGYKSVVEPVNNILKVNYMIKDPRPVSIIIPNKNHFEDLCKCISSVIDKSTYKNYEIVIIENGSDEERLSEYYRHLESGYSNIRVIRWDKAFNYAALNNFGVKESAGDYLLFLNNDTQIITPGWIEEMLMHCQREGIGVVGAKLIHPDNTIQHGGIILGIGGVAANAFSNYPRGSDGYMNRLSAVHNLSAVTAACMMTTRAVFDEVGGFEEQLVIDFNDVDYCLKVREAGYLVVWTPYCELYHYEQKSRGVAESTDEKIRFAGAVQYMQKKWGSKLMIDPYYNPNLTLDKTDFSLRV